MPSTLFYGDNLDVLRKHVRSRRWISSILTRPSIRGVMTT